jgi:hypothetical protein
VGSGIEAPQLNPHKKSISQRSLEEVKALLAYPTHPLLPENRKLEAKKEHQRVAS